MKKTVFLAALLPVSLAMAAPSDCNRLIDEGMTLTTYAAQCARYGKEERYQRFLNAAQKNLAQIAQNQCQETQFKGKDGLPHPASRVLGKERTTEVLEYCVSQRRTAEQLLKQYGG